MSTPTPKAAVVPFTVAATGRGVAQQIDAGGHRFETDAYPVFGGQDAHPSPLLYTLGSLSSCNQVTASIVARDHGIQLGEFTFEVVGDLDTSVFVNGEEGNANFTRVKVRVNVETDADAERFDHFVAEVDRRCPVSQLFRRSGLEFDSVWTNAPLGGQG